MGWKNNHRIPCEAQEMNTFKHTPRRRPKHLQLDLQPWCISPKTSQTSSSTNCVWRRRTVLGPLSYFTGIHCLGRSQSAPSLLHSLLIFQLGRAKVVLQNQTWSPRDFKTRTRPQIIVPIRGFWHPRDRASPLHFLSKPSRTGHRGGCGAPESYRHPRPSPLLVRRYSQATSMHAGVAQGCHSRLDMGISLCSRQFLAKPHRDQSVRCLH